MLKATKPDDTPVKSKHVERLVGVTYQISARYDIYDAVLRKLWSKMTEKDWRTTIKALYVLHRFSVDGAPDHQPALKARLRELRRLRDKRKEKFFNSKALLTGSTSTEESAGYRAFLGRYAHYVLLRAQCFGGMFTEIAQDPPQPKSKSGSKKSSSPPPPSSNNKPITQTRLKAEHLQASKLLLKAALDCKLRDKSEECEHTAIALERVVADLMALSSAVALSLTEAIKSSNKPGMDKVLISKWCEFYSQELMKQTRMTMKTCTPTLDRWSLFLPSRIEKKLDPDLLEIGLKFADEEDDDEEVVEDDKDEDGEEEKEEDEKEDTDKAEDDEEEDKEDENVDDGYEDEKSYDDEEEDQDEYEKEEEDGDDYDDPEEEQEEEEDGYEYDDEYYDEDEY